MKPAGVREITYAMAPASTCGMGVMSWNVIAEYHFALGHPYYSEGSRVSLLDSDVSDEVARERIRTYRANDEKR